MVFDRRFTAESPRYPAIRSNGVQKNDGLCPPLQDHCVLLTRSFLMVLGGRAGQSLCTRRFGGPTNTVPPV